MSAIQIMTVSSKSEVQVTLDAKKQMKTDGIQGMFSNYMKQSQAGNPKLASQNQEFVKGAEVSEKAAVPTKQDYEQYQSGSSAMKISNKPKSQNADTATVSQKAEEAVEMVKELIKEELGVGDEQIQDAMALLGLSGLDLLNPQNLMDLAMSLTGAADHGAMLFDAGFQNVLEGIDGITQALVSELGMSIEEIMPVLDMEMEMEIPEQQPDFLPSFTEESIVSNFDKPVEAAPQVEDVAATQQQTVQQPDFKDMGGQAKDAPTDGTLGRENSSLNQTGNVQPLTVQPEESNEEVPMQEALLTRGQQAEQAGQKASAEQNEDQDQAVKIIAQNLSKGSEGDPDSQNESAFMNRNMGQKGAEHQQLAQPEQQNFMQHEFTLNPAQVQHTNPIIPEIQNTQPSLPQIDMQNVIDQIVEYTKTNLTEAVKSIEMQLNPENLGKIYLHVTEKAGNVTAQITAQNESMKDSLLQQAIVLKDNLNQQGVKVDAIEVSVGTHEFEENLERDARQQEEQARQEEERASQNRRRSLDLNDLDDLSGLLTEEEELVARIMRDHGNNVDFRA